MSIRSKYSVISVDPDSVKEWFIKKHYAKRMPSITYCFALLNENKVTVGACSFGRPAAHQLVKHSFKGHYQNDFLELNRIVVNDGLHKNTCSLFISKCLNMLPKPKVIVSYADTSQGHIGYIYQCTNWIYTGLSEAHKDYAIKGYEHLHNMSIMDMVRADSKDSDICKTDLLKKKFGEDNIYKVDRPRKHRYFYFLGSKSEVKRMKKNLKYEVKPYPKGDTDRYDSSYKPSVQCILL